MPKQTNRTIQVISIAEYCHNKQARENFTFHIINGVGTYESGISQQEIDDIYPVPTKIYKQENSDISKAWMQDI